MGSADSRGVREWCTECVTRRLFHLGVVRVCGQLRRRWLFYERDRRFGGVHHDAGGQHAGINDDRSIDFDDRSVDFDDRSIDFDDRSIDFDDRSVDYDDRSVDYDDSRCNGDGSEPDGNNSDASASVASDWFKFERLARGCNGCCGRWNNVDHAPSPNHLTYSPTWARNRARNGTFLAQEIGFSAQ